MARPPTGGASALANGTLAGFPTGGGDGKFGLMTTGDASLAPTANTSGSTGRDVGGPNVRGDTDFDVTILRIDLCFVYAIVFAMVVKPTTDDAWTIAVAAAILVVLTVVFLAPLRSGGGGPASSTAAD